MPLPINIDDLIKGNLFESDRMEFKKGWDPEDVLHTICAFANDINNTGGGYIIIGIKEEDHVAKLPPLGLNINQLEPIQKDLHRICHYLMPHYFPMVSPEIYQEKNILVIWIPPGDTRPYKAPRKIDDKDSKIYYVRRLSSTVPANHQEERQLMELTARTTFDNRINQFASVDDINLTYVVTHLKEVNSSLSDHVTRIPALDIYKSMDIVRGPEEFIRPVNIGLLLFSDEPHKFFPGTQIDLIIYHDDVGDKFTEKIFQGPVHHQLRSVLTYFKNNIIQEEVRKIKGVAEADRFYNYPYEAVEESIANAVYHKSYEDQRPIEIHVRLDNIEIISYPGPMPPVSNEMLKRNHISARTYRNSRIGDFLKELGLTEGRGTGIPNIRKYLKNNGSPDPVFETDQERLYFLTILIQHPDMVYDSDRNRKEPGTDQVTDQAGTKSVLSLSDPDLYKNQSVIDVFVLSLSQVCPKLVKLETNATILLYCLNPQKILDIMKVVNQTNRSRFRKKYIDPLIECGLLNYTIPESITDPDQKYLSTEKTRDLLLKLDLK
ncbi:MAG: hypothetical protein APR54_03600 [Candidatus Cloacimonas sp. SDB]|nr:MAG: hypothetical protein APR54_03600 [Candidatus Cloacimonas sp. SDB]